MKRFLMLVAAFALSACLGCDQAKNPASPQDAVLIENETTPKSAVADSVQKQNASENQAAAATITVPDDYPTIQAAVDAAVTSNVIQVRAAGSPYNEVVLVATPGLTVRAEKSVTVNGGFDVRASNVLISEFNIVATGFAGVAVVNASGVRIEGNTMTGGYTGIWLGSGSVSCVVTHNTVSHGSLFATVGISMYQAHGNAVKNNSFTANDFGITMQSCNNNEISGNTSSSNLRHGITISESSSGNAVKKNVFNNNGMSGLYISGSANSTFGPGNTANFNAQHGIMLFGDAGNNTVRRNNFHCNGASDTRDDVGTNIFIKNSTGPLPGGCL